MLSPDDERAPAELRTLAQAMANSLKGAAPEGTSVPMFMAAAVGLVVDGLLNGLREAGKGAWADAWLATLLADKRGQPAVSQSAFDRMVQDIFGTQRPPTRYDA